MLSEKFTIKIINNIEDFSGLRDSWNDLLVRSSADNIFLTWEFCFTWWKAFNEKKDLMIIVLYDGSTLVGIAPLYCIRSRQFGVFSRRQLEFIGSRETFFEGLDFIFDPDRESELLSLCLNFLISEKKLKWDVLNLTSYRQTSKILPKLCSFFKLNDCSHEIYAVRESAVIDFPETFSDFLSSLSKGTRDKQKYFQRRLLKLPEVYFEFITSPPAIDKAYVEFVDLHQKRQTSKGNEGSFRDTRRNYNEFHSNLVELVGPLEWIFIAFIRVGDKLVSGMYNYNYHGHMYAYALGFDPEWSEYRPGNVLTLTAFEHLLANTSVKHYDSLRGVSQHKLRWTKNVVINSDIAVWRNSITAKNVRIEQKLRSIIKSVLPQNLAKRLYERHIDHVNS